jgi:hypothetical protein
MVLNLSGRTGSHWTSSNIVICHLCYQKYVAVKMPENWKAIEIRYSWRVLHSNPRQTRRKHSHFSLLYLCWIRNDERQVFLQLLQLLVIANIFLSSLILSIQLVLFHIKLQLLVAAYVVPSSLFLSTLMMEEIYSSETSVLTRATRRHIQENSTLHL